MITNKISVKMAALLTATLLSACTAEETVSQDDFDSLVLLSAASNINNAAAQLELNGIWNSFTGSGTTSTTIRTISATISGGVYSGATQTDGLGFGGFSSCGIIQFFDNAANVLISQNPPFNGACFAGDTNNGRFFKEIWIDGPTAGSYWTCTVNGSASSATVADALAVVDNTDKSDPGTTGCGGFAWSRLEPRI